MADNHASSLMAPAVVLNVADHAGLSTFEKDVRRSIGGKRVHGMLGLQSGGSSALTGYAGLSTQHLAELKKKQHRRPVGHQQLQKVDFLSTPPFCDGVVALPKLSGAKPSRRRYATEKDYREVFDTRWRPDPNGRMALYLSRKPGHAALEANSEKLDMILTFHRERGSVGSLYKPDNLCNDDGFLTGHPEATRDVLKPLGNREAPYNNPDGPFELPNTHLHPSRVDHLDRTCNPKETAADVAANRTARKGRMRVLRERSHIVWNEGGLVGDETVPTSRRDTRR